MEETKKETIYSEKIITHKKGMKMLFLILALFIACTIGIFVSASLLIPINTILAVFLIILFSLIICICLFCLAGFKIINPNEALVLTLFGNYYGTLKEAGFYWVNPFCSNLNPAVKSSVSVSSGTASISTNNKKISLKAITLDNNKQKVNDQLGNPIEIGAIVIWKVDNTAKAVFNVDNYKTYVSIQCDTVIRNAARCYPYDTEEGSDEKSLRGSSQEVSDIMKTELQKKVEIAGIQILEVRITHLAYAPEIASAMLQRQQAVAIIAARQKIVEGAVGMVEMALDQLNQNNVVNLDEERKAAMVSNLLVVLCGNKDAQPIVNSGSIY